MKNLTAPFKGFNLRSITQTFHPGHRAIDCYSNYYPFLSLGNGAPLVPMENSVVEDIRGDRITPGDLRPATNGYGIWLRGQETGMVYLYWHTHPIFPVNIGDIVLRGKTIIGFMGNSGLVFSGSKYVPIEDRVFNYNKDGTHLHLSMYPKDSPTIHMEGRQLNPLDYIDIGKQPIYNNIDLIKAVSTTTAKILKLI